MKASVVLVEPEKAVNLGLIARLVDNFEIERLILVNPQFTTSQLEVAKILASHSARRIDSAIQVDSLEEALSEADLTVATSARGNQQGRNILRRSINLRQLQDHLAGLLSGSLSLVFGRDGTGLKRKEIELCDLLVNIELNPSNPVLNLACAVSIVLHDVQTSLRQVDIQSPTLPSRDLRERVVREFQRLATRMIRQRFRARKAVRAFSNAMVRSGVDEREATLILGVLRKAAQRLSLLAPDEPQEDGR